MGRSFFAGFFLILDLRGFGGPIHLAEDPLLTESTNSNARLVSRHL